MNETNSVYALRPKKNDNYNEDIYNENHSDIYGDDHSIGSKSNGGRSTGTVSDKQSDDDRSIGEKSTGDKSTDDKSVSTRSRSSSYSNNYHNKSLFSSFNGSTTITSSNKSGTGGGGRKKKLLPNRLFEIDYIGTGTYQVSQQNILQKRSIQPYKSSDALLSSRGNVSLCYIIVSHLCNHQP